MIKGIVDGFLCWKRYCLGIGGEVGESDKGVIAFGLCSEV